MQQLIDIPNGGLHACVQASAVAVQAHYGTVWITHAGDHRDHVVRAGQELRLAGAGRVVVQALGGAAQITIKALVA